MALRKFTSMFLIKILIVLPIFVVVRSYHGYNSYREYYRTHTSGKDLKYPVVDFERTASELFYNNDAQEEAVSRLQDRSKRANLESNILFPVHEPNLQARNDSDNVEAQIDSVAVCKGQTFCEETSLYPEELVNEMLAKDSSLMHHANAYIMDTSIELDSGGDFSELCSSMERIIFPRMGLNIKNEWLFIAQSPKLNFTQAIRIKTCEQKGRTCRIIEVPDGYYSMCKQQFSYLKLLALAKNRQETVFDFFRFPASCCCHVMFSKR